MYAEIWWQETLFTPLQDYKHAQFIKQQSLTLIKPNLKVGLHYPASVWVQAFVLLVAAKPMWVITRGPRARGGNDGFYFISAWLVLGRPAAAPGDCNGLWWPSALPHLPPGGLLRLGTFFNTFIISVGVWTSKNIWILGLGSAIKWT